MATVTRAQLAAYLAVIAGPLADEAGISAADQTDGMSYALDLALADLGDDTANTAAAYALAELHAYRRVLTVLASRTDFQATGALASRNQLFRQTQDLIADAASRAAAAGHPTQQQQAARVITWTTDWIEPEPTA